MSLWAVLKMVFVVAIWTVSAGLITHLLFNAFLLGWYLGS